MTDIKLVRGDTNYNIEFIIKDAEGSVIDLTNATVVLKMQSYQGGDLVVNLTGEIPMETQTSGVCKFVITDQFQDLTGEFQAEIQITYSGGKVITAPNISIKVIPDLPS